MGGHGSHGKLWDHGIPWEAMGWSDLPWEVWLDGGHGPHLVRQSGHKISKIVATRCQILRLKCNKFDFRWGSAPDPAAGAYSTPPEPLTVFKGPTSNGTEGKEEGKGRGREREGEVRGGLVPQLGSLDPPVLVTSFEKNPPSIHTGDIAETNSEIGIFA